MYEHYSFDLWLTLIKSNPLFKPARIEYFFENYNFSKKTKVEIKKIFRKVDLMCNLINEKVGKNVDAMEMYLMVLYLLDEKDHGIDEIEMAELYQQMEELVLKNTPILLNQNIRPTLIKIREQGATTSILSNTGFIKGTTLRKVLTKLKLLDLFDFVIFSDEIDMSKPNNQIYELLYDKVKVLKKSNSIKKEKIVHIGDNYTADYLGAKDFGFNAVFVDQLNTIDTKI
jgi:putative hydrolase of the HAD superfamily